MEHRMYFYKSFNAIQNIKKEIASENNKKRKEKEKKIKLNIKDTESVSKKQFVF